MEDELHDRRDFSEHDHEHEDEESAEGFDPEGDDEAACSCSKTQKNRRTKVRFYITLITAVLSGAVSLVELISALSNHF